MSASLVGSEMCIRDSPVSVHRMARFKHRVSWRPPAAASPPSRPTTFRRTCLLYTSDAADDM
eukprot:5648141-Alexandrium_andersonii.AAC.1